MYFQSEGSSQPPKPPFPPALPLYYVQFTYVLDVFISTVLTGVFLYKNARGIIIITRLRHPRWRWLDDIIFSIRFCYTLARRDLYLPLPSKTFVFIYKIHPQALIFLLIYDRFNRYCRIQNYYVSNPY